MIRFSLKTLFGTMVLAAVVLSALFALPAWAGCWLLLVATVVLGAAAAAGSWFARGAARTFCVAVFVAGFSALILGSSYLPGPGLVHQPLNSTAVAMDDQPLLWPLQTQAVSNVAVWHTNLEGQVWLDTYSPLSREQMYQYNLLSTWGLALLAGVTACMVRVGCSSKGSGRLAAEA